MIKHETPWVHYTWENFFTFDEQEYLYDCCMRQLDVEKFESGELFLLNGHYQNQTGVDLRDDGPDITLGSGHALRATLDIKIKEQLNKIASTLGYTDNRREWSYSFTITKDLPDQPLLPHTDDYEELKIYNAGIIKVLSYLGKPDLDYSDWGTKLYESSDTNTLAKEIPYVPGNAFIFTPNSTTWHGTDFKNNLNGYRFMLGAELVWKDEFLEKLRN